MESPSSSHPQLHGGAHSLLRNPLLWFLAAVFILFLVSAVYGAVTLLRSPEETAIVWVAPTPVGGLPSFRVQMLRGLAQGAQRLLVTYRPLLSQVLTGLVVASLASTLTTFVLLFLAFPGGLSGWLRSFKRRTTAAARRSTIRLPSQGFLVAVLATFSTLQLRVHTPLLLVGAALATALFSLTSARQFLFWDVLVAALLGVDFLLGRTTARVIGHVHDGTTEHDLPGARVELRSADAVTVVAQTVTSSLGSVFLIVPPRTYRLVVTERAHVPHESSFVVRHGVRSEKLSLRLPALSAAGTNVTPSDQSVAEV